MCGRLGSEGRIVFLGLGSGKILSYDPVTKVATQIAKCTLGIEDIAICSEKKLAVVDTNSTVRFFVKDKLVHTLPVKTQFVSN